ncbi:MAG: Crp/Fnr family transcriptional regulator [Elusimicrobia bacterium]|nr:Crp/Fnr family transcriptional regulator [Elusimicrobiota bacterium]
MPADMTAFLERTALGSGCSRDELERLAAQGRVEAFAADEEVGAPGDLWLRAVRRGVLGLVVIPASGRAAMVDLLEPGDVFGPLLCASAWMDEDLGLRILTLTPAEVLAVPQKAVQRLLSAGPRTLEGLLAEQRRRISRLVANAAFSSERIDRRVIRILLRLTRVLGPEVPLTRRVLALAAGATTETVIRTLAPLERAGWISSRRGSIQLTDALALRDRLERRTGAQGRARRRRRP